MTTDSPRRPRWHEPEWVPDAEERCVGGQPIGDCWSPFGRNVYHFPCVRCSWPALRAAAK